MSGYCEFPVHVVLQNVQMEFDGFVYFWAACAGRHQERRPSATEVHSDRRTRRERDQQLGEQFPLQAGQMQAVELRLKICVALLMEIQRAMEMLSYSCSCLPGGLMQKCNGNGWRFGGSDGDVSSGVASPNRIWSCAIDGLDEI